MYVGQKKIWIKAKLSLAREIIVLYRFQGEGVWGKSGQNGENDPWSRQRNCGIARQSQNTDG